MTTLFKNRLITLLNDSKKQPSKRVDHRSSELDPLDRDCEEEGKQWMKMHHEYAILELGEHGHTAVGNHNS
jgi:hypothetical protein